MNAKEATRAVEVLAASPASKWIGNRVVDGVWLQKCMRCGAEQTLALPQNLHGPEDVPVGFDELLFDWKRSFQIAHEGCVEDPPKTTETRPRQVEEPPAATPGITMKRFLQCAVHGSRRWQGHVMCDVCGRTYQTTDARRPGHAPEICPCGHPLLPPAAERVGDVLGLRTGGVLIDEEARQYQSPEATDWTARPICYLCHRRVAKHHGGRVPIDRGN